MTKLILADALICAASDHVVEEPWGYRTPEAHFPFTSGVTGVVEVELPEGFRLGEWRWESGELVYAPPPPPQRPAEEVRAEIVAATQARLDAFARERNYDDIKSACDYAGCSVDRFSIEGTYCRDVRAETWAALYAVLDEVQAGDRPMPTGFADIEDELPPLVWPG